LSIPAHLFRREGIFYFRWSIPANVRVLLLPVSPSEVRISLRCHDRRVAIPVAFQLWQRALALAADVIAAAKHVGYTDFMAQLKLDAGSSSDGSSVGTVATTEKPEPLAELLGTYDVPTLQRAVAALQNRGAAVFASILGCDVTLYKRYEVGMNEFEQKIDSVESGYYEANVQLLPETLIDIVSATGNFFSFQRFLAPRISFSKHKADFSQPAEASRPVACNITSVRAYRSDVLAINRIIGSGIQGHSSGAPTNTMNRPAFCRQLSAA
jgi:hypothetical protein